MNIIRTVVVRSLLVLLTCIASGIIFNQFYSGGIRASELISVRKEISYKRIAQDTSLAYQRVSLDEAYTLFKTKAALFVDARQEAIFKLAHIRGAVSCYYQRAAQLPIVNEWPKDKLLVLYCGGVKCDQADQLAETLVGMGFTNIHIFPGGMDAWRPAGYPIDETKAHH